MSAPSRMNNFGVLRLLFASLVILSHSPELLDGNRSRELAIRLWGTMSFGEIAVDGFFVISGYLITLSYLRSSSIRSYLLKRVLRIYPAFIACSALLIFVVAPLAGSHGPLFVWNDVVRMLTLDGPHKDGAFHTLPYPVLNGAMWSVPYEFRCYVAVIALGSLRLLRFPRALALLSLMMLFATSFGIVPNWVVPHAPLLGFLPNDIRTCGVFLVGVVYCIKRQAIPLQNGLAVLAAVALFFLMFFKPTAEPAFATLGGYLIFWLAEVDLLKPLSARLKDDISYGLYLYAWPVTSLLIYYGIIHNPWALAAATLVIASGFGWLSWRLVEQPMLSFKPRRGPSKQAGAESETRSAEGAG